MVNMSINIYYNIMLLVFLPLLVIQTRFLLTKQSTDEDRKGVSQTLIEIVPHDLLKDPALAIVRHTAGRVAHQLGGHAVREDINVPGQPLLEIPHLPDRITIRQHS